MMEKPYKKMQEYALSFPSMGWLALFFLLPTLVVISFCFRTANTLDGTLNIGYTLQSLIDVLSKDETYVILIRTAVLSIAATSITVFMSLPLTYYIASLSKSAQHKLILLIILPFWSSFLVRIFAWKTLLHPDGVLKSIFVFFGFIDSGTSLLYNNMAVLTLMVYSYLPFAILPLYTSASKFNFQLIEAALDLGATRTKAFFSIFVPSMKNAIITSSIMVLIPVAGAYVIPDIVGGVDSEMLGNKIVQSIFIDRNLPEASSYSLLLTLMLGLLVLIFMCCNRSREK